MEEIINVTHKRYGAGRIIDIDAQQRIKVKFEGEEEVRLFLFPDAFLNHTLETDNDSLNMGLQRYRRQIRQENQLNRFSQGKEIKFSDADYFLASLKQEKINGSHFFLLVNYALENKMCLQMGCTTCGCARFRSLCRDLGLELITEMVQAVSDESLKWGLNYPEYTAITLINIVFRNKIPRDNPLMRYFDRTEAQKRISYERRQEEKKRREAEENRAAEERKRIKREKHQQIKDRKKEERDRFLPNFKKKPLLEQVKIIAEDDQHTPHYYAIDYEGIDKETVQKLETATLHKIEQRKARSRSWSKLRAYARKELILREKST